MTSRPELQQPSRYDHPGIEARQRGQILKVQLACLLICVVLGIAIWANLPYMLVEHSRLEIWKIVGLWIGDLAALIWFGRFLFAHALLAEPLVSVSETGEHQEFKFILRAGILALVLDLSMSIYLMADQWYGYKNARAAQAEVSAIQVHKRELADWYDLDSMFVDASGVRHKAHLRVQAKDHVFSSTLRKEAVRVLSQPERAVGKDFPIRYDPRFPARAWIEGVGWDDGNNLYWFSIGTSLLQAGAMAVFLLMLRARTVHGQWPWWWDVYKILPLGAEAFCMLMMGLIDRFMDSLS